MSAVTVFAREGEARASSRDVAGAFEKNHRDVLRSIDNLLSQEPSLLDAQFCAASFKQDGARQEHRCFEMNRAGFMLLVMGFTGPKALKLKLAWIAEFDRMEDRLRRLTANEDEPAGLPIMDADVGQRMALMTEVRRLERNFGHKVARAHLMASGRFEHLRPLVEEVEATESAAVGRCMELPPPMKPPTGTLWQWVDDRVTVNLMTSTPVKTLYANYEDWCRRRGFTPMHVITFRAGLTNGFGRHRYQHGYALELKRRSG